jgi:Gas vesicle protein K
MKTRRRAGTARASKRAVPPTRKRGRRARTLKALELEALPAGDIEALRAELERNLPPAGAARWNVDPQDVQRSVAKLVLTLMEFLRKLLERQAIRRMEARTLTPAEVEAVGVALMRLEETLRVMGERFGLTPDDLNLDLGPLGRLI